MTEKIWFRGDFCHFHLFTPKQNFCCAIVTNAPHGMSNLHVSLLCKSSCLPSGWNGGCFGKFRPSTGLIPRSGSTLHFPLLPGCSRHSGCCWAVASCDADEVFSSSSSDLPIHISCYKWVWCDITSGEAICTRQGPGLFLSALHVRTYSLTGRVSVYRGEAWNFSWGQSKDVIDERDLRTLWRNILLLLPDLITQKASGSRLVGCKSKMDC